jgi:hypothetical protein
MKRGTMPMPNRKPALPSSTCSGQRRVRSRRGPPRSSVTQAESCDSACPTCPMLRDTVFIVPPCSHISSGSSSTPACRSAVST